MADVETGTALAAGEHKIYFVAQDGAANSSSIESLTFTVDDSSPVSALAIAVADDGNLYDSSFAQFDDTSLTTGSTYYATGNVTLSGTITEANLSSITTTLFKDGESVDGFKCASGGNAEDSPVSGAWSFPATTEDGEYIYRIILTDKAEQTVSYMITVVVDTLAPSVEITTPSEGESYETNEIKLLKGTHEDSGSGINTVTYSLNGGSSVSVLTIENTSRRSAVSFRSFASVPKREDQFNSSV